MFINRLLAIGACLFLLISTPLFAAQTLNKVVAIVNNGVITQMDLDKAMTQAKAQASMAGLTLPDQADFRRQVLNQLITNQISIQLATMNGLTVQKIEVDNAIDSIAQRNGITVKALQQSVEAQGINFTAYRDTIKNKLLMQKLEQSAVASSIRITPEEVSNFLKTQQQEKGAKQLYQVDHILIALPENPDSHTIKATQVKANKVLQEIKAGLSFTKAAMKYSDAGDALKGGILAPKTLGQLPELFAQTVTSMKAGQIVGPIKTDSGFQILKLVSKQAPKVQKHLVTQYHVQWIMVKTSPILSAAQAKTHLLSLYNALENGASFAAIAKANSQDVDSAENGGDAGWLTLAALSPQLAQAIQSAKLNQVSKPLQVGKDWYLIEVLGQRNQDDTAAYRNQQAERALFQRKAQKAVMAWQAKIRAESYVKILPDA